MVAVGSTSSVACGDQASSPAPRPLPSYHRPLGHQPKVAMEKLDQDIWTKPPNFDYINSVISSGNILLGRLKADDWQDAAEVVEDMLDLVRNLKRIVEVFVSDE